MIAEFLQSQKLAHDGKRKAAGDAEGDESKTKKKKDDVSPNFFVFIRVHLSPTHFGVAEISISVLHFSKRYNPNSEE